MSVSSDKIRIPPQDIEAEMSVIGSLMLDKEAIFKVVDYLHAVDFYKPLHKEIYESILDVFKGREPIDILTVTARI